MTALYTDIDYDSFPVADLSADIHWIQLPEARWEPIYQKILAAREQRRLARLPKEHKIILVPTDPDYSPGEFELWPLVNRAVRAALAPHPEMFAAVTTAVKKILDEHRGWRSPFPVPFQGARSEKK